ncbi:MAG: type II toxin-antitoxin system prevent-host-death family antitoxin [Coriobacteriia bacterium]|nr:type II toxin-antitoxin system prevent-host-death family antitoxin [Coriobacteriia bacterium]
MTTMQRTITSAELAGRLGEVLDQVERGATYTVTRRGRTVAVLTRFERAGDTVLAEEAQASYGNSAVSPPDATADTAMMRLLAGTSIRQVLALFLRDPAARLHQREIARRAGVGLRSAQLALNRLCDFGILSGERDGNRLYYGAERTERFEGLRALLSRELGIAEVISRHLAPLGDGVSRAFIFGSVASGTDSVSSDIDLLVVGSAKDDDLVGPISAAQRELGREIDLVRYSPEEFELRRIQGNHFIGAVLERPTIAVIGARE